MAQTYNHDLVGIINRFYRVMEELHKSQSSGQPGMVSFDQDRLSQYLAEMESQIAWVMSQPDMDLPESHPTAHELDPMPDLPRVENESINDIIRLCKLGCIELENSQSARRSAKLNKYDHSRCTSLIAKIKNYLNDHIATSTPSDLPESSPRAASSGAGRLGI
jgi:hypothetical protein